MSRKLDAAVAELLGYRLLTRGAGYYQTWTRGEGASYEIMLLPAYSTDGNASIELDREAQKDGWDLTVWREGDRWYVVYERTDRKDPYNYGEYGEYVVKGQVASTMPEAVALAYIKAKTGKGWTG